MSQLAFFDTNILVYTDDAAAPAKREKAIALFRDHLRYQGTAGLSLPVLQEYFAAAKRKLRLAPETAQRKVEILGRARVIRFDVSDLIAAIELHRLTQVCFWDAMILHAARLAGVAVLYSEDLQHESAPAGVRVVNPFLA